MYTQLWSVIVVVLIALPWSVGRCQTVTVSNSAPITWDWALTYARGSDIPFGPYYSGVNSGSGSEWRLARAVSHSTVVRFSYTHYGIDFEFPTEFIVIDMIDSPVVGHRLTEVHLDAYSFTLGAVHYFRISRDEQKRTTAYLSVEVGLARHTSSGNVTIWESGFDTDVITYHTSETDDHGLLRTGGGLNYPLRKHFLFDVGAGIDWIWVRENSLDDFRDVRLGLKGYIFRLTAGLTWTI